jgi:hypothetical protein
MVAPPTRAAARAMERAISITFLLIDLLPPFKRDLIFVAAYFIERQFRFVFTEYLGERRNPFPKKYFYDS